MVGMMTLSPREKVASLMDSAKFAMEIPLKLKPLRQLHQDWFQDDPVLVSEFLHNLLDLQNDRFSPVRKFVTQMIGEIGLRHIEIIPEIVPVLLIIVQDNTPAVARQAITCGFNLFRSTLEKVSLQGLFSNELDESLETSWAWMLKFKEKIFSIAFQPGSDSIRLKALKFVEAVILLYTPDPNGSSEPPPNHAFEGNHVEFNVSWLRGGHPLLKVGELSIEAGQSLGIMLDQLRFPRFKSLSSSMIIVLVNSLAAMAKKRPGFYGRILPVLLSLDPSNSNIKGVYVSAIQYALEKAFLSCLQCTHTSAVPWRERLNGALKELKAVRKTIGSVGQGKVDPMMTEEKPLIKACDAVQNIVGQKRPALHDSSAICEDDISGKRVRLAYDTSEGSSKASKQKPVLGHDENSSVELSDLVQQHVAMFGALVAQGEKAVGSLEILIQSLSADLLTDIVMANMQNLPSIILKPKVEEEDMLQDMGALGGGSNVKHSLTLLADVFSRSGSFPQVASSLTSQPSVHNDVKKDHDMEFNVADVANDDHENEKASLLTGSQISSDVLQFELEKPSPGFISITHDVDGLASGIPGLESVPSGDGLPEAPISSFTPPDLENASQEHATSLSVGSPMNIDILPSMLIDRSEELSPKSANTDAISSMETSMGSSLLVLPKMNAPILDLNDEEKDYLQLAAFTRIIEAYKQIAVAGGSHDRISVLAYLGVEFPLELDAWKFLQKHILSDYVNHEGQEFTLRVLYRLFGEAEEENDFFSSTTAKSAYEMFLLTVAETLRDSFLASDKSLSKLLGEVPYLPKSVFTLLENLCCPGSGAKDEKELENGDRVMQGLSAVWSLILQRPPIRDTCLNIALQSAVHHLEEVRMKAIRLVANKLYPIPSIAQRIEDFAKEVLLSMVNSDHQTVDRAEADGTNMEKEKESHVEQPTNENQSAGPLPKYASDSNLASMSESALSASISEAQRCTALFFALCTKKHSLFRQIFTIYRSSSKAVKQTVERHIPILVRTIGSSSELLEIISNPPSGSEDLLMQVLNTLTDGTIPSPELISAIRRSYDSNLKNVEILIPILPFLPRDELLLVFPRLVTLPLDKFQAVLARVLQRSSPSCPDLTPAEVLSAIHRIDPDRDGIPLKKITDACNACFEQRQIFTQQVLAKVLNQMVEQIPLPLLFMRTVLQAIGVFPGLVDFIMEILSRLVSKQIWKYPKQWVGFLKCAQLTQPQSFSVLLQLPPAQLENAINRIGALKAPLTAHADQPNIKSLLPRSVLVVLGIAQESQASSQAQTSSQAVLGSAQDSQASSQAQAQTTSQSQIEETSNSDKEAVAEITKESSSVE